MVSEDVFALVQLDPPGIELCRISNLTVRAGMTDGGGGGPRMDKLCTLLLAPLQHGARADWAVCVGEHPGHQAFSRGPWPEYRRTSPRRQFRQSPSESIVSVMMQITGSEGHVRIFDVVVRCATLLAHAAAAAAALSSTNGMDNVQVRQRWDEGREDDGVPWAAWGPRATSVSDHTHVGANDLLGERRTTIDLSGHRVRINDYNLYRIRQAVEAAGEASKSAEDPRRSAGGPQSGVFVDVDGDEWNRARENGIRRMTETSTVLGGEWFREDVTTSLPYLETTVYVPRCKGLYMEQDQLLLHVDALNAFTGRPSGPVEGFLLYRM